jgi:hypothetical protein
MAPNDSRGTRSRPTTTDVTKGAQAAATSGESRPPGGAYDQHLRCVQGYHRVGWGRGEGRGGGGQQWLMEV